MSYGNIVSTEYFDVIEIDLKTNVDPTKGQILVGTEDGFDIASSGSTGKAAVFYETKTYDSANIKNTAVSFGKVTVQGTGSAVVGGFAKFYDDGLAQCVYTKDSGCFASIDAINGDEWTVFLGGQ